MPAPSMSASSMPRPPPRRAPTAPKSATIAAISRPVLTQFPSMSRFTTLDLRSIRSRRWILRLGLDRLAAVKARKRLDNRVGSEDGELRAQAPGRLPGFDRQAVPGDDRSGIESLIHAHDRDAGLGV